MSTFNKLSLGAIGVAVTGGMLLASSAFAAKPLPQGYQLAAAQATKTAEGKCGEGKCGSDAAAKKTSKAAEGKCGEGKCGEGKCGDASFAKTDTDNDGRVSRPEFLAVAPTRSAEFDKLDADHNNYISELEAYKYLKATYEANGKKIPADKFSIAELIEKK